MPLWGGTGRALRRYRRAAAAYRRALAPWQEEADALRAHLTTATTFAGATAADEPSVPLQLAPGERVFSVLERASLVEPRNRPERWAAGYTGFSFRLARGVRYRPATTERKKEQGEEAPAAVDKGMATITDQRVVFHGSRRTRERRRGGESCGARLVSAPPRDAGRHERPASGQQRHRLRLRHRHEADLRL